MGWSVLGLMIGVAGGMIAGSVAYAIASSLGWVGQRGRRGGWILAAGMPMWFFGPFLPSFPNSVWERIPRNSVSRVHPRPSSRVRPVADHMHLHGEVGRAASNWIAPVLGMNDLPAKTRPAGRRSCG
jgi:hypothetical protein